MVVMATATGIDLELPTGEESNRGGEGILTSVTELAVETAEDFDSAIQIALALSVMTPDARRGEARNSVNWQSLL